MSDQVFRVMLRMEIKPGMGEQFERVWTEVGNVITDHPANLGQWLLKNAEDENVYHIMSDWVDEPLFREFETSDQHLEHRTKLHPYRSGGSMTTAHVVVQLQGAAAGVAGR
ncbi:antibiotic biosynthesis monooxygenase [Actinomadura barringtoniae]|uniref:Antibiotic biosynthesis monooxygenase n=1 Tax=Actinomadura barringtoniae TaxID=1427535 RepID=A0A939T487_9ACTN|nr:antibiotic biosynthesis monooxygenase family protein [Actinomadura barringtoniae]MBO2445582.1 antibiotic biosynthesis monooxygenase [Actinomadura barringtoniae]